MIYFILRPFVLICLSVYYRIDMRGLSKIPPDKPVVIAPNHVNGFVDPVLLCVFIRHRVRFFARGDVFKGKFALWILNQMNVSPMYRIQEGYAELKKNDKTFEECRQLLTDNKSILLFPEGICIQERRLHPLKKGLARIVLQASEEFDDNKDIQVIPVGLNYSEGKRFRSKVFIDIGDPISVKEYESRYKQDKVRAINDFTKMLETKMAENVVIIKDPVNDELVAGIEDIYMHQWLNDKKKFRHKLVDQYEATREIVDMVNRLDESEPELIASLRTKITSYIKLLKNNELRDHLLRPEAISKINIGTFILEYMIMYLGMPIYFLGLLMNYPPYFFVKRFADKTVKKAEFYASFRANLSLIAWTVYVLLELIIVAIIARNWSVLLIYGLLIPLTGLFVLKFYPVMKKISGRWRLLRMVRKERTIVERLMNERSIIIDELNNAKKVYLENIK